MSKLFLAEESILLLDDDLLAAMAAAVAEAEEIIAPPKLPKFGAGPGVTILPRVSRMPRRIPAFSAIAAASVWAMPSARIRATSISATAFSDGAQPSMHAVARAQLANALGAARYAFGLLGQSIAIPSRPIARVIRSRMLTRAALGMEYADARLQVIDDDEDMLLLCLDGRPR